MSKLPPAGGLLLAALVLTACGGSSDAGTAAPSSAPASSAPAGSAPGSSAPADPSTSAAPAATDPCQVLDAPAVSELTGVKVRAGSSQVVRTSTVCTWAPVDGGAKDAAVFSAQEGPLPAGLGQVADQLKTQFNGKVSPLEVQGADDARYIVGTTSGLKVADVVVAKDQRFYQVLVASPRDAEQHKDGAVRIAEALLKA